MTDEPINLEDEIDQAAIALLQAASGDEADETYRPSLADRTKAFEAATKWWETRGRNQPPEPKKEPGVVAFRREFHRQSARRGGGGPTGAQTEPDSPASDA